MVLSTFGWNVFASEVLKLLILEIAVFFIFPSLLLWPPAELYFPTYWMDCGTHHHTLEFLYTRAADVSFSIWPTIYLALAVNPTQWMVLRLSVSSAVGIHFLGHMCWQFDSQSNGSAFQSCLSFIPFPDVRVSSWCTMPLLPQPFCISSAISSHSL